jgi:hypothetical protein
MPRNDDPEIGDEVLLWRAILKSQVEITPDGTEKIQSWGFIQKPTNEVSGDIVSETTLARFYDRFAPSRFRVAEFTAGDARACRNIVCRDPEGGDPSHVLICPSPGKSKGQIAQDAKRLARRARLRPDGE